MSAAASDGKYRIAEPESVRPLIFFVAEKESGVT
jgi:hypothetical protein